MRGAPIPPEEYAADPDDPTEALTDAKLEEGGWAYGLDAWEQLGKAYEWYLSEDRGDHPAGLDNAQMWSLQEAIKAHARRGDPVAEWIKRRRDEMGSRDDDAWRVLDDLLDDYRMHADTGTSLAEEVAGPHGEVGR